MIQFIQRAIILGIPLLFGCTGETITEKSGHLNLGIPGIMYVGGICGVIGGFFYEQGVGPENIKPALAILIPLTCSILGSLIMGLVYSFFTVSLRANQNVTGLALTTFGTGIGNFFGGSLIKLTNSDVPYLSLGATSRYFKTSLPFADKLGWFGQLFLRYSFLVYVAIILALAAAFVLKKTRTGLHLRAVGENPATADAAGIPVEKYKYIATCTGAVIAGLGGLFYVMDYSGGIWANNAFGDQGWLAIALVIFTVWRTDFAILGSFVFGALLIVHNYITNLGMAGQELIKVIPYAVTIIVLIVVSAREKRETQPPQALGQSYFREDR